MSPPARAPAPPPSSSSSSSSSSSWSLRQRLARASSVLAALIALSLLTVGLTLAGMVRTQREVTGTLFDAVVESAFLYRSMVDQQSGLRGYQLSGDPAMLRPFEDGVGVEQRSYERLLVLLEDEPMLRGEMEAARRAALTWRREIAEPQIAEVGARGPGTVSPEELRTGETRFNDVRSAFTAYRATLLARRDQDVEQLQRETVLLAAAFVLTTLAALAAGLTLWRALRRWVTDPLAHLGSEVRQVQAGDLGRVVAVKGPLEIRRLAQDVDAMRERVVEGYTAAVRARAEAEAAQRVVEEQAVELRRSNQELEQFAYVASHDLQEPLRKVASFCQMLERRYQGQLDERGEQYLAFAIDGAKRMQVLINDLLAFSRIGRVTTGFGEVDLGECLRQALDVLDARIAEVGAEVTYDELPVVRGEASLLTQLFQNLVGNALKFTDPSRRPPRVHVGARRVGDEVELECADNGIGIEPQYADRIFVIFQRLHVRDEYGGTGIGLALCKKIVEYHGGRIWLDAEASGPGRGTTFRWALPALPHSADGGQDAVAARPRGALTSARATGATRAAPPVPSGGTGPSAGVTTEERT